MLLPAINAFTTVLFPFGSLISKHLNPRLIMLIGAIIGISLIYYSSYQVSYWPFFFTYSLGFGVGNGIAYGVPIYNAWKFFPEKKALVTGIVLCGFGLGSFIFGLIATHLINPENEKTLNSGLYPPDVNERVPSSIRILSLCWGACSLLGIILTFTPP